MLNKNYRVRAQQPNCIIIFCSRIDKESYFLQTTVYFFHQTNNIIKTNKQTKNQNSLLSSFHQLSQRKTILKKGLQIIGPKKREEEILTNEAKIMNLIS